VEAEAERERESQYRLINMVRVDMLEEGERARRMNMGRDDIIWRDAAELEMVKQMEEEERAWRVKRDKEDNRREQIKENVQSYRDMLLVKELEEEERQRRIALEKEGDAKEKANLEVVKSLEEAERLRRMRLEIGSAAV